MKQNLSTKRRKNFSIQEEENQKKKKKLREICKIKNDARRKASAALGLERVGDHMAVIPFIDGNE